MSPWPAGAGRSLSVLHGSHRQLNPSWVESLANSELADSSSWFTLRPGQPIAETDTTQVYRVPTPAGAVIFKRYRIARPWRYWLRPGRAATEWRGLVTLQGAGIPVPELVAFGEDRRGGMLVGGYVVTREIEDAEDLETFAVRHWYGLPVSRKQKEFNTLRDLLFRQLHRAHAQGLFHRDLFWRNILVRRSGDTFDLWWIDCPRFARRRPYARHPQMVDLSCLARAALSLLPLTGRYRSLLQYLDGDRARARELMAAITAHHRRSRHPPRPYDPKARAREIGP